MENGYENEISRTTMSLRPLIGKILGAGLGRSADDVSAFAKMSWAQEGEDLILYSLFDRIDPENRFFVDVGANHPQRFSNTWLFYQEGWRGINIDPFPGSMEEFERLRPRDINLEIGVAEVAATRELYLFCDSALSTFSDDLARVHTSEHGLEVRSKIEVSTATLTSIFEQHLSDGFIVDFMSVDVEGAELEVLQSLDWTRWRPTFLLVEELEDTSKFSVHPSQFLREIGYETVARTPRTTFFKNTKPRE